MRPAHTLEEFEALVAYHENAPTNGATAWAVVEAAGVGATVELLERLRARFGSARVRVLEADDAEVRAAQLAALLAPAPPGADITVVGGLSEALTGEHAAATAGWLNLRREVIEQPGESRVVLLTSVAFDAWLRLAPDLHRYAQHFRSIDSGSLERDAGALGWRISGERGASTELPEETSLE